MMPEWVGFILPPFIDLVNKHIPNTNVRFAVTLMVCLALGALFNMDKLKLTSVGEILESAGLIFASAQVTYKLYWKDSTVREKLSLSGDTK